MTLDVYGHLFPDQLEEVAGRLERASEQFGEAFQLTDNPWVP